MLGRSFLTAGSVMFWVAIWAGCSGSSSSGIGKPKPGGDNEDASTSQPDDKVKDDEKNDAGKTTEEDAAEPPVQLPPTVDVTYGDCPAFAACGGSVVGTWNVTSGCVSDGSFADLKQGACANAAESDVVIKAAGVVTATATTITRNIKVDISAKVAIPKACAAQAGGSCQLVAYGLSNEIVPGSPPPFDKATCNSDGDEGCNCTVSRTVTQNETVGYTVSGSTLTTDEGQTLDFCVDGKKITYQETTAEVAVPITVELTKQ